MGLTDEEHRKLIEGRTGTHWAIVRVYRPPKLDPRPEPEYVEGDDGPLLFDREKDAGRWRTHLRLGRRSWSVVKVRMGEDGKLRQTFL